MATPVVIAVTTPSRSYTVTIEDNSIDRDRFMSPEEAKGYGLIDEIVQPRALAA